MENYSPQNEEVKSVKLEGIFVGHCDETLITLLSEQLDEADYDKISDSFDKSEPLADALPKEIDLTIDLESEKDEDWLKNSDDKLIVAPRHRATPALMDTPQSITLKRSDNELLVAVSGVDISGKNRNAILARDLSVADYGGWSFEALFQDDGEAQESLALSPEQPSRIPEEVNIILNRALGESDHTQDPSYST